VLLGLGISLVAFVLTEMVPGDPAAANLGQAALSDPAAVHAFQVQYGLNKPLPEQYFIYVEHLLQGNLGISEQSHRPVLTDLEEYAPATAELALTSVLIAYVLGIALGVLSAVRRNKLTDQVVRVFSLAGVSAPTFWLALVALYVFFFELGWVPGGGRLNPAVLAPPHVTGLYTVDALLAGQWNVFADALEHLILPACVLAAYNVGLLTRFTRAAILEVIGNDYILAARAKGLPERTVLFRHVLRAALPSIITVAGLAFANVMTGAVLVESIFSWPGIGEYAYVSATTLDLPAIMGVTIVVAVIYIVINMGTDVLYAAADPRIHLG
jgi:peptide/nickel transport system permease protein